VRLVAKRPKTKCCRDKPRCTRCPIAMLAAGTLPDGYTVRKRRLVRVDDLTAHGKRAKEGKKGKKAAKGCPRLPEAA
jgi:hypothetical protein